MMEYAGGGCATGDGVDADRDRVRRRLPAASAGAALSALPQRHAADPQPLARSAAARDSASLVPGVRLERRGATRAREADTHRRSPGAPSHRPLIPPRIIS